VTTQARGVGREIAATLRLGVPVVFGQVGIMAMQLVDTALVGRLGPEAIGAVGVGSAVFFVVFLFGIGLLAGLDRVVSFDWGAGRVDRCRRSMVQGVLLALGAGTVLTALLVLLAGRLEDFGVPAAMAAPARAYLRVLALSVPFSLVYTAMRQTLQATGDTTAAAVIAIAANLVNLLANLGLVFGRFGLPALGVVGSGWATVASRASMVLALTVYAGFTPVGAPRGLSLRPDRGLLRDLLALGLPAGLQYGVETAVFTATTLLVSRLGAVPLAAHQVVMLVASFTFQIPLGMASAGAVRVGQALGAGDGAGARRAGWTAVGLGVGLMALSACVLLLAAAPIAGAFSPDAEVVGLAANLLAIAGMFQIFDGAQVTFTGVLRGAGDTRTAMWANLGGHWLVGLPLGWTLCFRRGAGAAGMWLGLAAGLAGVATLLLFAWRRRIARTGGADAGQPG